MCTVLFECQYLFYQEAYSYSLLWFNHENQCQCYVLPSVAVNVVNLLIWACLMIPVWCHIVRASAQWNYITRRYNAHIKTILFIFTVYKKNLMEVTFEYQLQWIIWSWLNQFTLYKYGHQICTSSSCTIIKPKYSSYECCCATLVWSFWARDCTVMTGRWSQGSLGASTPSTPIHPVDSIKSRAQLSVMC